MESLRECPLCGSEAEISKWKGWYVACKNTEPCGCLCMHDFDTKEEAINAWNRRPSVNNSHASVTKEEIKEG